MRRRIASALHAAAVLTAAASCALNTPGTLGITVVALATAFLIEVM